MRKNIILLALISIGFQSCLVKALMKKVGIYDKTNTIEKISDKIKVGFAIIIDVPSRHTTAVVIIQVVKNRETIVF